jgi:hypothetical protein
MVIRVTEVAHAELHRRAAAVGLDFSDWALAILLADPPPAVPGQPAPSSDSKASRAP